jgi:serine/threonine protein kinase/tetratricopeptide (TPR) repeat protein
MNSERLKKIEEIYHAALAVASDSRTFFLNDSCGDDLELRNEVETLLAFDTTPTSFLDDTPKELAAQMLSNRKESDPIGQTIGHYTVLKLLGVGGMGKVYLAEDTRLGRKVALKLLPATILDDSDRMARFVLEAKAASALNHPNIITIHEIGESEGTRFIATEFIDGETLTEHLRSNSRDFASALDIGIQIASALKEAHSAGIVHRDIKPDNVMVRPNGLVKILDFGVAKLTGPAVADAQLETDLSVKSGGTMPGVIIGTADYMSPEQARGGDVDQRSDIFSFGVLMYEMLAGKRAFTGENALDIIGAILHKEPISIADLQPDLPASVIQLINGCLSKDINERFQSIEDVLADLRAAKKQLDYEQTGSSLAPRITMLTDVTTTDVDALSETRRIDNLAVVQSSGLSGRTGIFITLVAALLLAGGFIGYWNMTANRQIRSIAVMPFVNMGGDVNVEYLSDGMTENLIRSLSSIPDLSIKARSTVFTYKGKETSPRKIGEELKVDAVLIGKLLQTGDELKLDIELVDAVTQDLLWSQSYGRKLTELAAVQSDIARDVAERLRPELSKAEQNQVGKSDSNNSEAQRLYLKGRFHWNKRNVRDLQRAADYFNQAIEIDPRYALAYTGLADSYSLMPLYGNLRPHEFKPKAKQSALKALELDGNLAEAHASLGYIINTYDFDWDGAEREYKTAIRLNPNYPTARQWYAEHLAFRGMEEQSLEQISTALELDPLSLVINRMKGNVLMFAKRHDEAIAQLNKTGEMYPENALVRINLAEAFAAKGMDAEAIDQYLTAFKLDGKDAQEIQRFSSAYKSQGWRGFWTEYLTSLLILQNAAGPAEYVNNESIAYAYAATKNKEKCLEFLARAYDERDPGLTTVRMSAAYDFLNDDPRFKELIKKIGLPE